MTRNAIQNCVARWYAHSGTMCGVGPFTLKELLDAGWTQAGLEHVKPLLDAEAVLEHLDPATMLDVRWSHVRGACDDLWTRAVLREKAR